jgi:hypothetical protein
VQVLEREQRAQGIRKKYVTTRGKSNPPVNEGAGGEVVLEGYEEGTNKKSRRMV